MIAKNNVPAVAHNVHATRLSHRGLRWERPLDAWGSLMALDATGLNGRRADG